MSAIRGKRGQAFLREMLAALDAMPEKKLITEDLERQPEGLPFALREEGGVCAMGSVGKARGIDMTALDPHEPDQIAATFGVAEVLAREIAFENDEGGPWWKETPEARWARMRKWIESQIKPQESGSSGSAL